jgi:hypothetical protein
VGNSRFQRVKNLLTCSNIRYRGNVSTEAFPSKDRVIFTDPLPSNDKGIFTEQLPRNDRGIFTKPLPSDDKGIFTEPLSGNDRGIQRHTQQRGLISLFYFLLAYFLILKKKGVRL